MSEPTFHRIVDHTQRLGLWRLKDSLGAVLAQAEPAPRPNYLFHVLSINGNFFRLRAANQL